MKVGDDWDIASTCLLEPEALDGELLRLPLKITTQTRTIRTGDALGVVSLPIRHGKGAISVEPLERRIDDLVALPQQLMATGQLPRYLSRYPNYDDMLILGSAIGETLVPVLASPPSSWKTLAELLAINGAASTAIITGAVNSPVGYLAVLASAVVYVEVGSPVLRSVGRNLSDVVDAYFRKRTSSAAIDPKDPDEPQDS